VVGSSGLKGFNSQLLAQKLEDWFFEITGVGFAM